MSEKITTIDINSGLTKPKKEIVYQEVTELELPIKIRIEKIRTRIENGEYGLIIGDDASGRIPTLILGNFIKKVSEQKGLDKPNIIFIPGAFISGSFEILELDAYVEKWGMVDKDKRILVVTDSIRTGESLRVLVSTLKDLGYPVDVATIGIEDKDKEHVVTAREQNLSGIEVLSGDYNRYDKNKTGVFPHTPKIYGRKELAGVEKVRGELKSRALSRRLSEDVMSQIQPKINQAKEDAGVVTDHIVKWYESQKQKQE